MQLYWHSPIGRFNINENTIEKEVTKLVTNRFGEKILRIEIYRLLLECLRFIGDNGTRGFRDILIDLA